MGSYESVVVTSYDAVWNTDDLYIGMYGNDNGIEIVDGGQVLSRAAYIGDTYGENNYAVVSGAGSQWTLSSRLSVGGAYSSRNRLTVSNGGVVRSAFGYIGGPGQNGLYNLAEIKGGGQWNISGSLVIGNNGEWNRLDISGGGSVTSSNSFLGAGSNSGWKNSVIVSGAGSKWVDSGIIQLSAEANSLVVSNGGEVAAMGGLLIGGSGNTVSVGSGGRLRVGSDFNAAIAGFSLAEGAALCVDGELSGYSLLPANCRLETDRIVGDFTVHGTFAPGNSPADSVIAGDLTIASDGMLEMELGGYAVGGEYDRLSVQGAAALDGTLDLVFLDSFSPTNGAVFNLFNWNGGVSGTFASINTPALSGGLEWDTSALYTAGTLGVIPEPAVISLLAAFGGAMLFIRRRFRS